MTSPHAGIPVGTESGVGSSAPSPPAAPDTLLTPAQVASLFHVDPKTVTRWAQSGKLSSIRTLGGHRRYRASEVYGLLGQPVPPPSVR